MVDLWRQADVVASVVVAVIVPFLVVPEILEWRGYNRRSAFVRGIVWASFLAIVFLPAVTTGYLFSITNPLDWLIGVSALLAAVLWDYYRLNPDKRPWLHRPP